MNSPNTADTALSYCAADTLWLSYSKVPKTIKTKREHIIFKFWCLRSDDLTSWKILELFLWQTMTAVDNHWNMILSHTKSERSKQTLPACCYLSAYFPSNAAFDWLNKSWARDNRKFIHKKISKCFRWMHQMMSKHLTVNLFAFTKSVAFRFSSIFLVIINCRC